MKRLLIRLEARLLKYLQRRCDHPGDMVAADILEGCWYEEVRYCRHCGAYKFSRNLDWDRPDPTLWHGFNGGVR